MNRIVSLLVVPLVLVAGCGGGSPAAGSSGGGGAGGSATTTASGPASGQSVQVDGTNALTFAPSLVQAKVGALALTFANTGQVPHNLVFDDSALGRTATVDGGSKQVLTLTLSKAGTYAFQCTFHPGMTGKLVVS